MSDGLPDPAADPVSPLIAAMMNAAVRTGGAAIEKSIEVAQDAPGKVAAATQSVAKKGADVATFADRDTAPKGETIKAQKELARGQEIEPTINASNAANVSESLSKAGIEAGKASAHFQEGAQAVEVSHDQTMQKQVIAATALLNEQTRGLG